MQLTSVLNKIVNLKHRLIDLFQKEFGTKKEEYLYVILPLYQGQMEMDEFVSHAAKYGAFLEFADGKYTRIFRMTKSAATKMPHDDGVPYIGRDDSGHALHEVPEEILNDILRTGPYWPHCWSCFVG